MVGRLVDLNNSGTQAESDEKSTTCGEIDIVEGDVVVMIPAVMITRSPKKPPGTSNFATYAAGLDQCLIILGRTVLVAACGDAPSRS